MQWVFVIQLEESISTFNDYYSLQWPEVSVVAQINIFYLGFNDRAELHAKFTHNKYVISNNSIYFSISK